MKPPKPPISRDNDLLMTLTLRPEGNILIAVQGSVRNARVRELFKMVAERIDALNEDLNKIDK